MPTVGERADFLLLEALKEQTRLSDTFCLKDPRFVPASYSHDRQEVDYLIRMLSKRGDIEILSSQQCRVLPAGHMAADRLIRKVGPSDRAFVAMSFDSSLDKAYNEGHEAGIWNAGYDPVRVDRVEHVNRIDDKIIALIRTSAFVVADFTGHRGGVYFEAGFALGLNLPVIWTCRADDMKDLHFDIRQFNMIKWDAPTELAMRLQRRIEATLGKGPRIG